MSNVDYAPRKLTESYIKSLEFNDRAYTVRDTHVVGLMVAVNKKSKSYKIQRDLYSAHKIGTRRRLIKTVRHTLGTVAELSLPDARTQAKEVLALVERGVDPNAPTPVDSSEGVWTVRTMYAEYIKDMEKRKRAPRSILDIQQRRDRYMGEWLDLPINQITRRMARDLHQSITDGVVARNKAAKTPRTKVNGERAANQALADFSACYKFSLKVCDDPDSLPPNPASAVSYYPKDLRADHAHGRALAPEDLPSWWTATEALSNPLRRLLHQFGLLSGLRPGTLVSLRREWLNLPNKAVRIPLMKTGRAFDLPLSDYMVRLIERALEIGDMLYPGSEYVFPTRDRQGNIVATVVWKEKGAGLHGRTGHFLRHSHRTLAKHLGIDDVDASLLLDHKVAGIQGVYIHAGPLFERLQREQQRLTDHVLGLAGLRPRGKVL